MPNLRSAAHDEALSYWPLGALTPTHASTTAAMQMGGCVAKIGCCNYVKRVAHSTKLDSVRHENRGKPVVRWCKNWGLPSIKMGGNWVAQGMKMGVSKVVHGAKNRQCAV